MAEHNYLLRLNKERPFLPSLRSLLPPSSGGIPLDPINQGQQYRHFNKWPNGSSKCLVRVGAKGCNGDGDSELKVIARGSEALSDGKLVSETYLPSHDECCKEDETKIDDERRCNSDHRHNLMDDLLALRSKQHEDSVK